MKPIGHPDYRYQPWSEERRAAARARTLARNNTPKGYRKVYGINVPEELAPVIAREAHYIRRLGASLRGCQRFVLRFLHETRS